MTDDELAAVVAAIKLLRGPHADEPAPAAGTAASRWSIAARMRALDVVDLRLAQRAPSRWAMSERLRD